MFWLTKEAARPGKSEDFRKGALKKGLFDTHDGKVRESSWFSLCGRGLNVKNAAGPLLWRDIDDEEDVAGTIG
jgi:hypothetical protein